MSRLSELIDEKLEQMYDDEKSRVECEECVIELLKDIRAEAITTRALAFVQGLHIEAFKQIDFLYPPTQKEIEDTIVDDKRMSERNGD